MADVLTRDPAIDEVALPPDDLAPLSDEELAAQALAAAPTDVADEDAVDWFAVAGRRDLDLLPAWYMPTAAAGARRLIGWRRNLACSMIGLFLSINAAGLCFTYGRIEGFGF